MSKTDFVLELTQRLSFLPWEEVEERLDFYVEMIDERMEEGLSEAEAVRAVGSVDEIVAQIIADTPLSSLVKEKIRPKRRKNAVQIVLLILGSPVWLSLLIAVFAVILSVYACLWAVIISLWAVFGSVVGCALGGVAAGVGFALGGKGLTGVAVIGAGIACAGVSIFLFYGCKGATKGLALLTKKMILGVKNDFAGKKEA